MKRITFMLLMLITSVISFAADNIFYGDDVTIAPGETATVTMYFDNADEGINTIDFFMNLPEWLEYVEGSLVFVESRTNDEYLDDMDVQLIWRDATKDLKFTYEQSSFKKYSVVGSGKFFTFKVKASDSVEKGTTGQITFNLDGAEMYKGKLLDDVEFSCTPINVTVGAVATTEEIYLTNEWNTYCSTNILDFYGTSADTYVVTKLTQTSVVLGAETVIPAGVGFLIKGTEATTITPAITTEAPSVTSLLVGVTTDTDLPAGHYVLHGSQFVPSTEAGTLSAHKAYLDKEDVEKVLASGAKFFTFDFGESTGINEVQATQADGAIYNLNGMRVGKMQKGVYIMNGRKVIVK